MFAFAHPGDPYCEEGEVMRGVTLSYDYDYDFAFPHGPKKKPAEKVDALRLCDDIHVADGIEEAFLDTIAAPPLPIDPMFRPQIATSTEVAARPAAAGNRILEALRSQPGVLIAKVRPRKFTLKAKACLFGGHCCVFKVFIYDPDGTGTDDSVIRGRALVELQRRSGDALAFRALLALCARAAAGAEIGSLGSLGCMAAPVVPGCYSAAPEAFRPSLLPLLAVASSAGEEEVAPAMLAAVEEAGDEAIELLSLPEARAVFERLLSAEDFLVAYPAARTVALLAPAAATSGRCPAWLTQLARDQLGAERSFAAVRRELHGALQHLTSELEPTCRVAATASPRLRRHETFEDVEFSQTFAATPLC